MKGEKMNNSSKPFKNSVDRKKITSIILTTIMLLSIFSGISASVVGNDNNEVVSPTEDGDVGAMAVGSLAASLNTLSPSANIANESANYTDVFWIRLTASGESANLTSLSLTEAGTIHGTTEITGVGINDTLGNILVKDTFSADNGTTVITFTSGFEVPVGTLKDLYVWVNTTSFNLGDTIKLTLESFNATGLASGQAVTTTGVPLSSNEIAGTGKLTLTAGTNNVAARTLNAGANTTGIVLAQLNFTATIEACTLNTIMLTEIGTANGTKDFSAIYLINDTDADGVWDSNEPRVGNLVTTFSADNGTATISGISKAIAVNCSLNLLVVANTTSYFWSGDTLKVNITNVTDFTATGTTSLAATGTYGTLTSAAATGKAMIQMTAGANQPSLDYVLQGERGLVESAQLNFTAIAGQVNITQITLEQATTTNWSFSNSTTYPKIYLDNDKDGNVTALDTQLNVTALNFAQSNVTLVSNYIAWNTSGGAINVNNDAQFAESFTSWGALSNGSANVWLQNVSLWNVSGGTYVFNISVDYVDVGGVARATFLNYTNYTLNELGWLDISSNFPYGVRRITNMTMNNATCNMEVWNESIGEVGNTSLYNVTFAIVAPLQAIDVVLDTNLTIGSASETDAGQASKTIIIAVNTTSNWLAGNYTKALPVTITTYGNYSNYVAYDNTTGLQTMIYQSNAGPSTTSMKQLSATDIPGVTSPIFKVAMGSNPSISNIGKSTNLNPALQLNFSYSGTVGGLQTSTVYVRQIVISANGTVNEAGNVTACLVVDTNDDGAVSAGETIIATTAYATDNETLKITLSSPIELTLSNANVTSAPKATNKNVLLAINVSSNIVVGNTFQFYMENSSVGYIADTGMISVVNQTSDQIVGNALLAAGSITATRTNAITDGTVSSVVSETYVELMQLKFTASSTEAVNITSINVTWNGTGNGYDKTSGIGVINDTDMDGVWDLTDTERVLNQTTFGTDNVAVLNLTWDDKNITVPAGGSIYVLIYVNTTATSINASDSISVNITAKPYLNYTTSGVTSNVTIADLQTTKISSARMTAVWTGSMSVLGYNLTTTTWVEGAQTNFPVLALNFSATNETSTISSITITSAGTANESGNLTVKLVEDTAPFGSYESETVLATAAVTTDNGAVTLTPSTAITVAGGSSTKVLVVADITARVDAGTTLVTSLANPSTDYTAIGYYSGARIEDSSAAVSNTTNATGSITVILGANNTITGAIVAQNSTNVSVMQLNFSATPGMEDVVIWGINLTASGLSTDAYNDTWCVGIYSDTNNDGLIDDGDIPLGSTTFDANHTAVFQFGTNLTVNGTIGIYGANNETSNNTIVYVNTSSNFNVTDTLKIRLNSYNATGAASHRLLTASGVTLTSNTLTGTGNVTATNGASDVLINTNIKAGTNTSTVVWQLKLTAGPVENLTVNSIDITEIGTANAVTDIASIFLVNDTDANGLWNVTAGDSNMISNAGTFSSDNGRVTLTLTANNTITVGNSVNYLLVVNTASTFYEGETLMFMVNRSTTTGEPTRLQGITATGATSGVTVYVTNMTSPTSNATIGYASIGVYATTQPTESIYNSTATNQAVLNLNFSAPLGAVNITNITLKENGSAVVAGGFVGIQNVSVWYNGVCYNSTTSTLWTENGTVLINLSTDGGLTGMIVNGTTNVVTIKVNTTSTLAAGQTIVFELNRTLGLLGGYNASGNVSVHVPYSNDTGTLSNTITVQGAIGQISLKTGWNFISVPKKQDTTKDTFGELLSGIDFSVAYTYSPSTGWTQLTSSSSVQVLYGYWVYANAAGTINLAYLSEGQTVPASRALTGDAWNAIGFSNTTATSANATLKSVQGSWSTVIGWDATGQSYENAIIYQVNDNTNMNPYQGYWLWMTQDDTLSAISA
ncbi:MAG: hypothetical protein PHI16_02000 [Methanocellales archaeon]|nr:hypothetical protein [Methanocellales archaeon]